MRDIGWHRTMKATAILVALLSVAACVSHQPSAAQRSGSSPAPHQSTEVTVSSINCGPAELPASGYRVVDDGVAIPAVAPEGQPLEVSRGDFDQERRWYFDDHGGWLWAKTGLTVRGNTSIEISAPSNSPLRFAWGEQPLVPRRSVKVDCSQQSPRWMTLIGGYFANSTGCFPVDIRVGDRPTVQAHIQLGAACPQGQR